MKILESLDDIGCTTVKAPEKLPSNGKPGIFLAGSIEMGKAVDWQTKVQKMMSDKPVNIFNPRRDDWDSSWEQKMENDKFREQVTWELNAMEVADIIIVCFDPDTKSPITLMELGLHAQSGKILVCCPEGFWRKGNVDIVCARYGVPMYDTVEKLVGAACSKLGFQLQGL